AMTWPVGDALGLPGFDVRTFRFAGPVSWIVFVVFPAGGTTRKRVSLSKFSALSEALAGSKVIVRSALSEPKVPKTAVPFPLGTSGSLLQFDAMLQLPSESTIQLPAVCAISVRDETSGKMAARRMRLRTILPVRLMRKRIPARRPIWI